MSISTLRPGRRRRLSWVAATVGALVASTMALAAPATAADPPAGPVLKWQVSQWFIDHLNTPSYADGAAGDSTTGVVTFPSGVGNYDPATKATKITYGGSVTRGFVPFPGGDAVYSVTISKPSISVDAAGNGTISALVSSQVGAAAATTPTRATLTTFDSTGMTWSGTGPSQTITATPHWAGVLPAGSAEATELGIAAGQPVDGKSFDPQLLRALPDGLRAHFYASGSNPTNDAKKVPAQIVAEVDLQVSAAVTAANPTDGVTVKVTGAGFTPSDQPGDDGVYIGLAPAGGLPDVSSRAAMANFAGFNWIPGSAIVNGAFTGTLTAPADKLDPAKSYAVYTWRAHTHSTTSQDTETPVAIDFAKLAWQPATLAITGPAKSKFGAQATYTATLSDPAATGTLKVTGAGAAKTLPVQGGKAQFKLPRKLDSGKHTLTVAYSGDATHQPTTATKTVKVKKRMVKLLKKWQRKPTTKKVGKLKLAVKAKAGTPKATGKVRLHFKKGKVHKRRTVKLNKKGKAVTKLPRLSNGKWKIKLKYLGDAGHKPKAKTVKVKVKKRR